MYVYHEGAPFSASVSMSTASTRDSVEKCIARKYFAVSLSSRSPASPSSPFITGTIPLMSTTFKRVHFPPMRPHPRRAGNVNISLLAPRASSPRVHVYNGGNCAEFQPLNAPGGREDGEGRVREVRAGMHVSLVTLRSARTMQWRCIPSAPAGCIRR